jgi:hypothetical protein
MPQYTLTRKKWREFKTANELAKSPIFKKADVGRYIERFQKALQKWGKEEGMKALGEALVEASKVKKAFAKFVRVHKELGLKEDAEKQIKSWENELDNVVDFLRGVYKSNPQKLKEKDAKNMYATFNQMGI